MAVMEIARLTCQAGRGDDFVEALREGLSVQAEDPECLDVWFQRGVENPDEFLLHLVWTSIETHDAWRAAHRDRWRAHIVDLLDGLPQLLGHYQLAGVVKGGIGAPSPDGSPEGSSS